MPQPSSLACVRCGTRYPIDHYSQACLACRSEKIASNLTVAYDARPGHGLERAAVPTRPRSLWRWDAFLPAQANEAVTLGEGDTPLLPVPALGLGDVWVKDESRNPTWSFKDRLASAAVTMAKQFGARLIVSSSSGNAGAAAAAYAAKAGLPCIVFTFKGAAGPLLTQMRAYGAMVAMVEDKDDRWRFQSAGVEKFGWYPTSPFFGPVVGSNPFGMEGYKTIAYEIAEDLGWTAPDVVAVPSCYSDGLFGIWKGWVELERLGLVKARPRMLAAEPFGPLAHALERKLETPAKVVAGSSVAFSIASPYGTYQGLTALRDSDGLGVPITDEGIFEAQRALASEEGLYAEPSAVVGLTAVMQQVRARNLRPDQRIVVVLTSGGLKDYGASRAWLPDVPAAGSDFVSTLTVLEERYGLRLRP